MSRDTYERIARVYATDMGQSMAFDDIGYYLALCRSHPGKVLELGCGTGRILLPLLQAGIDITGIDQSPAMLEQLRLQARARGLVPAVREGSLEQLDVKDSFAVVLAPYSVMTYLTDEGKLLACLAAIRGLLAPGGLFAMDTFIPRPVASFAEFRIDYRRPHEGGVLQREKRIAGEGDCNAIERRYSLFDAEGDLLESWTTRDLIRPWEEAQLVALARQAGLQLSGRALDFDAPPNQAAQYVVLQFNAAL